MDADFVQQNIALFNKYLPPTMEETIRLQYLTEIGMTAPAGGDSSGNLTMPLGDDLVLNYDASTKQLTAEQVTPTPAS